MLGIVFTEFTEMVEEKFSVNLLDELITATEARLASRGVYTAVGNYDHAEILELVAELSRLTDVPVPDLVRTYGKHLFGRFYHRYPGFFEDVADSMSFLFRVESHIHREVRKLYDSAELPSFDCEKTSDNTMVMTYRSSRPFAFLALGLIEGCAEHFGECLEIDFKDLSHGQMTHAQFDIVFK